jgi:hypothetical protein
MFGALSWSIPDTWKDDYWIDFLSVIKASQYPFWLSNKAKRKRIAPG